MKNCNAQKSAKGILVAAIVWSLCDVGAAFAQVGMGAKTIEVKASHLSLISHPDEITRLILEAAGQPAHLAGVRSRARAVR